MKYSFQQKIRNITFSLGIVNLRNLIDFTFDVTSSFTQSDSK